MCFCIMQNDYDCAVQQGLPIRTKCYCGKEKLEGELRDLLKQREKQGALFQKQRRLTEVCDELRPRTELLAERLDPCATHERLAEIDRRLGQPGAVKHLWRDVRFEIELEKKWVIVNVSEFQAACDDHRPYRDACADASVVAVPVKRGQPRPSGYNAFPLGEDTDITSLEDDCVLVLLRLPNLINPRRNKVTLNMYIPPGRVDEFDAAELTVFDAELRSRCYAYAHSVSERWLKLVAVECPGGHVQKVERKRKRNPPKGMSAELAKRCLPIDEDVEEEVVMDPRTRLPKVGRCAKHLAVRLRRHDARWAATREVIAAQSLRERTAAAATSADALISTMATSDDPREVQAAKEAYDKLPYTDVMRAIRLNKELGNPDMSVARRQAARKALEATRHTDMYSKLPAVAHSWCRSKEHPSVDVIRKHYLGVRDSVGKPCRWQDVPKKEVPDSYVCGRCCNAFGKGHAAEDCPSKEHEGWVPAFERPMPHGLHDVRRLTWDDSVELLVKAHWVDAERRPVISRRDYDLMCRNIAN